MGTRLIIEDNTVYEIDEECLEKLRNSEEERNSHKTTEHKGSEGEKRRKRSVKILA